MTTLNMLKKIVSVASLCLLFSCGESVPFNNVVENSDLTQIPGEAAETIREMGVQANIPVTAGLYAPEFTGDIFSDMNVSRNIHYGPAERNILDVMAAKDVDPGSPVLVFVHGGGFGGGNKSSATSPFYDNIPWWAASKGLVGVNINYRYAPDSQWPSGIEDLEAVVSWLKTNIAWYGGDPDKLFFWGKSTGASHVADYMASRAKAEQPEEIAGAIFTSGFYVLGDEPAWENYYGDDVSLYPERNALPGLLLSNTPILATYAEFDAEMYHQQFNLLLQGMNAAERPMQALYLRGHSHMSETYAVGTVDESLSGPVLDFIEGRSD